MIFPSIVFSSFLLRIIWKILLLGNRRNDIHPPAIGAFFHPELHQIVNLFAHLRIFPIQIGLPSAVEVQEILPSLLTVLPGTSAETRAPVIRLTSVCLRIFPDIIVTIGILSGFPAFHKPHMLIGSVIHHQIHYHLNAALMSLCNQLLHILVCPESRINTPVIPDIIPVVILGRIKYRA